eukprot:scaffold15697_cov40-Cyclotella_meneghiniana.AAC.8
MFQIPWLLSLAFITTLIILTGSPTSMNFYKIALLYAMINHVWLLTLHYLQATVGRRIAVAHPPPKPDPVPSPGLLRQRHNTHNLMRGDMSSKVDMLYLPVFSWMLFEWSLYSHVVVQCCIILVGLIMWWIVASACLFTVGNFIDSHSNDGRF